MTGSSNLYLEFTGWYIDCVSYTDTIITINQITLETAGENAPSDVVVYLDDPDILRELKTVLGRKKALIGFESTDEGILCHYAYEALVKTGEIVDGKERREKTIVTDCISFGKGISSSELGQRFHHRNTSVLWRFSPLNQDNNVLPLLKEQKKIPLGKLNFDVIEIEGVLFNKQDVLKMLQVFKNNITQLYCEYDPAHGVACFTSPELDIEVSMTTVQELKEET